MATKYLAKGKQEIFQNCPKGDPALPVPYDSRFFNTTHTSLNVVNKPDPIDTTGLCVKVVNGSTGKSTSLNLKSTDTIGKLKQMFLEKRPGMVESLNLVFHGKPVEDSQCLGVLGVKAGATFITFQKCHGG